MTHEESKRLAEDARRNLPSLVSAFDLVREAIIKRMTELPASEPQAVLAEHSKLGLLMELDRAIIEIIVNGDHAVLVDSLESQ